MRRFPFLALLAVPSLVAAQGFGVYEHGTCAMGRAGVAAARPCEDGSAIFFNPAGLAGRSGIRATAGVTVITASGGFIDDVTLDEFGLDNPTIPVPHAYFTYQVSPKITLGLGGYAPYGLETRWKIDDFQGRFLGYNTELRAIYVQPTIGFQATPSLKLGMGVAYINSGIELHQRADLSTQTVPTQAFTFSTLGIPNGTDFADAALEANGSGFAVNLGAIWQVSERLAIGGHYLTSEHIEYDGDVVFEQVPTGLVLPLGHPINLPPICTLTAPCPIDNVTATQFGPTAALADGAATTEITLPAQFSFGFAYRLADSWMVMADVQHVVWSTFDEVTIDFANASTPDQVLEPTNDNTWGFRFGAEYLFSPKVTFRGGYLYHTAASPDEFVTPLLPEADRNEFTLGAGWRATPKLHLDFAYQNINQNDRRGRVFPVAVGNTGVYEFSAHLFGLTASYTF